MDIHEMDGYQEGNIIIWNCPICGRRVIAGKDGYWSIAELGDTSANHRGGVGGLTIEDVAVEELEDNLTIWREWADENIERLFESESNG